MALRARERESEIVTRRMRGQTFAVIADAVGLSISATHEAFWRCLAAIPVKSVEHYRVETLQRLEVLRECAWKTERRGRLPMKTIALLVLIEDRRCKLLGLDASDKYDPNAPPPIPPDRDAAVKLAQQNLSPEELRVLIGLMKKARGDAQPAVEVSATPTAPAPPPAPAPDVTHRELVAPPIATARVRQTTDPEPPSYSGLADYCEKRGIPIEDPSAAQGLEIAMRKWGAWHARNCDGDPKRCRHFDRR